jgi:uncharacterized protein (TIGR01244 family)
MNIVKHSDSIGIAAQITPENVAEIAAAGYRVLVNNRPDGEEGGQPNSTAIAAAAIAAGLVYHHLPVTAMNFPGPHFDEMADLLDDASLPVLAFCRTGTRCANLWVASCDPITREAAIGVAQQSGFDLGMVSKYVSAQ